VGLRGLFALGVTALTATALPRAAAGNPADVFGLGSRASARAGAVVATSDDFASGYYNPAGLAWAVGKQLTFGAMSAYSNLTIQDRRVGIEEPSMMIVGLTLPAPLGGPLADRLHLGLGMCLPPHSAAHVIAHLPDDPFFPLYDNRTQRVLVLPGAAVKVTDRLAVGMAVNFAATLDGQVLASEGATRALEARIDEQVPSVARINAGVAWRPWHGLSLGAAYRQKFSIPFATAAHTTVAGEPIDVDIAADGLYTPTTVTAGAGWRAPGWEAGAQVDWAHWSAYPGPYVRVSSALPLVGPLAGRLPEVPFTDSIALRAGGEVRFGAPGRVGWALRGGWALETSPVPARQPGVTNLMDGLKNLVAAGFGVSWPKAIGGKPLRVDVHLAAQLVAGRTLHKEIYDGSSTYDPFTSLRDEIEDDTGDPQSLGVQVSNPGFPSIRSGGQVFSGGLTVGVDL
jgi:long-subunit fatty acid transport protein